MCVFVCMYASVCGRACVRWVRVCVHVDKFQFPRLLLMRDIDLKSKIGLRTITYISELGNCSWVLSVTPNTITWSRWFPFPDIIICDKW